MPNALMSFQDANRIAFDKAESHAPVEFEQASLSLAVAGFPYLSERAAIKAKRARKIESDRKASRR